MKTTFNALVNDIREYIEEKEPFELCANYENEAEANADIADTLKNYPEAIINYLEIYEDDEDEAVNLIARIKTEGVQTA